MNHPVFIIGSGRSGTAALARVLNSCDDVTFHHEYMCMYIQPLAFKYYHRLIDEKEVLDELWKTHGAAWHYTDARIWGDASNKLSWLVYPLDWLFPDCKFIQVIRDGRKVVSSFYNKLNNEIYHPDDVRLMDSWLANSRLMEPPPEKRYWWNLYNLDDDQFQNICNHWVNVHDEIEASFEQISEERKRTFKLEGLVSDPAVFEEFLKFVDVEYEQDKFDMLKRPHNVYEPVDYGLTEEQDLEFWKICGLNMERYGYTKQNYYNVDY